MSDLHNPRLSSPHSPHISDVDAAASARALAKEDVVRRNPTAFRRGRSPRISDVFIAFVGSTMSGKSNFISLCCGKPVTPDVYVNLSNHDGRSNGESRVYPYDISPSQTIYLIDTPGFFSNHHTSTDVLRDFSDWLNTCSGGKIKLETLLYFYDPVEDLSTFEEMTLPMIQDLSGGEVTQGVALVVSPLPRLLNPMDWRAQRQDSNQSLNKESEFCTAMISRGVKVFKHDGKVKSAQGIIRRCVALDKNALELAEHNSVEGRMTQNEEVGDLEELGLRKPDRALIRGPYPSDAKELENYMKMRLRMDRELLAHEYEVITEELSGPVEKIKDPKALQSPLSGVLPTDSGYDSAHARSGVSKHTHGQNPFSAFWFNSEGVLERGSLYPDSIPETIIPDDATVYSVSSTDHPQNADEYISAMARELVDLLPSVTNQSPATMSRLVQSLPEILKAFSLMIGHCADSSWHRDIMYFVHKYRSEIVDGFTDHVVKEESSRSSQPVPGMTVDEKMSYWYDGASTEAIPGMNLVSEITHFYNVEYISSDKSCSESDGEPWFDSNPASSVEDLLRHEAAQEKETMEDKDEIDTAEETGMLLKHREHLINSSAYDWLRNALEREILLEPPYPDIRGVVRRQILDSLPPKRLSRARGSQSYDVVFEMDWDPHAFVKEYDADGEQGTMIDMAITVTSTSQDAQALTTSQYLSQTWPSTGPCLVRMIQGVLDVAEKKEQHATLPDKTRITAKSTESSFIISASGSATSVAELAELLSWLGAALRPSPLEQGIIYCTPHISRLNDPKGKRHLSSKEELRFRIGFELFSNHLNTPSPNGQCWHRMFRNPVVVFGYPIARREETETGLEMPLDMMALMVRTRRIVPFGNTYFLKGFSSMLALVELKGDTFLWHHVYNRDGGHVSYLDHEPSLKDTPTFQQLTNARHVVGWCSEVKFYAGALDDDVNYAVQGSNLPRPHSTCVLDRASISGGKFVPAGVGIRIGVAQSPVHIARDTYFEKMKWVAKRYAIFWDEEENRGWLVNGPSALLHLILASIENDLGGKLKSNILFKKESLETPTNQHTTDSALEVLTNQKNKQLEICVAKVETWKEETTNEGDASPTTVTKTKTTYTRFEDRVEQIYCFLEQAMEHQTSVERQDGVDLKWRARKHLEGWDFRDFATSEDFIYPRVKTLQTFAKGWVDFTREINATTIFGKNFGEIIRPAHPASLCGPWTRHPSRMCYLAACISDLKEAPEIVFNGNEAKVGKRVIWHVPDDLFKPCECTTNKNGKADHSHIVQMLAPQNQSGKRRRGPKSTGQARLDEKGAVIFGYNSKFPLRWLDNGDPAEEEVHEERLLAPPQPREEEFHDSGIGSSAIGSSSASGDGQTEIIQVPTAPQTRTGSKSTSEVGAAPSKGDNVDRYTEPASASEHVLGKEASEKSEEPSSRAGDTIERPVEQLPRGDSLRKRFKGGVKALFLRNLERVRGSESLTGQDTPPKKNWF